MPRAKRSKSNPAYANLRGLKMKKPKSEEEAKAKTVVFWNINLYPVPSGFDPRQVRPCIEQILKDYGYSGPLKVTAAGDLKDVPHDVMRGLLPSGVSLLNNGHMTMRDHIYDFLEWNQPPATVFTISNPEPCLRFPFLHKEGYNLHQPFPSCDTFQSFLLAAVSGAPKEERLECDSYWDCFVCRRDPPGRTYETLAIHLSSEEHHELASMHKPDVPPSPVSSPPMPVDMLATRSLDQFSTLPYHETDLVPEAVTSVFWDLKACPVPTHLNPRLVGPQIKQYLKGQGYSGPITITAVGALSDCPDDILQAVFASGINLHNVFRGSQDIDDVVFEFTADHSRPVNVVLIMDPFSADYIKPFRCNRLIISSLEKALTVQGAREEDKCEEDKCAEWVCSVCTHEAFQGFENLTKHLSDNAHKRKMLDLLPPNARFYPDNAPPYARFEHQDNAHGEGI